MKIVNDKSCSWINDLSKRSKIKCIKSDESCDWLIIGAGYTGLSVARKLSEIDNKILIEVRGKKHEAKVSKLPFYKKSYVK